MTWYRTDKQSGQVESVSDAKVLYVLEGNYKDPRLAMAASIDNGSPLQTPFAYFEWKVQP